MELRDGVFGAGVIARTVGIAAAQVDHRSASTQLLRIAAHVAVGPRRTTAAAQVAGERRVQAHRMAQPLADPESDRYPASGIGFRADLHAYLAEYVHG